MDGNVRARGAHRKEPSKPENLSIFLESAIAEITASVVMQNREKFCAQYSFVLF